MRNRMNGMGSRFCAALVAIVLLCAAPPALGEGEGAHAEAEAAEAPVRDEDVPTVRSIVMDAEIGVYPGVFPPLEADAYVLPLMKENAELFKGARVLEIGTGSGIISVFAGTLGAKKVVSTDISEHAVRAATGNAARFGLSDVMEVRLVSPDDISAYSVIGEDEKFDIIISNPPYSLDLEASENTPVVDTGDLGFSIVRGLETHLEKDGTVFLLYGSLFYHLTMVKFARFEGYEVTHHRPRMLFAWEAQGLFNCYADRLLAHEKAPREAVRFAHDEPFTLQQLSLPKEAMGDLAPMLPGNSDRYYPGLMVIRRKQG